MAVLGFMVTQPGRTLLSAAISSAHPVRTRLPTPKASPPANKVGSVDDCALRPRSLMADDISAFSRLQDSTLRWESFVPEQPRALPTCIRHEQEHPLGGGATAGDPRLFGDR